MKFDPTGDLKFQLNNILNEGVEFEDQIRGGFAEVVTTAAEQEIQHNLGYTPTGFILLSKDGPGDLWTTRLLDWNSQSLFLASSVTNLTVRLFVM